MNTIREKLYENSIKVKIGENYIQKEKYKNLINEANKKKIRKNSHTERVIQRWMPDYLVKNCQNCTKKFGMFASKYHCYVCGDVFCSSCLINEMLPPFKEKVKSCSECYSIMKLKYS
jgi:hypothetical protein